MIEHYFLVLILMLDLNVLNHFIDKIEKLSKHGAIKLKRHDMSYSLDFWNIITSHLFKYITLMNKNI